MHEPAIQNASANSIALISVSSANHKRISSGHYMQRRLAAIVSADVEGYSRLMGEDEAGTGRPLTSYREVRSELIRGHTGGGVGTPPDNLLPAFGRVLQAFCPSGVFGP